MVHQDLAGYAKCRPFSFFLYTLIINLPWQYFSVLFISEISKLAGAKSPNKWKM